MIDLKNHPPIPETDTSLIEGENRWYVEHTALIVSTTKWVALGVITGILVGGGTRLFLTVLRISAAWLDHTLTGRFPAYFVLPLVLPLCVWLVKKFAPTAKGHGTEAVIAAVHERDGRIEWKVAPIKLAATVLTIMFGGSVGKEGPCAQIGASITSLFADLMKLSPSDRRQLVICGIGAGFAAVFGTPVAGALFGIEVLYLGRIEYAVLFPCLVSGIVAHLVCGSVAPAPYIPEGVAGIPPATLVAIVIAFGALCGLVAMTLIESMRRTERLLRRYASKPYLIAFLGGIALVGLYHTVGTSFAGLGTGTIDACLSGSMPVIAAAFAVKIMATTVSLETGGSGGIVTPLFYIGATFGAAFAEAFHLPVGVFAAVGFIAVAAAAANTPIAMSVMAMSIFPASTGVYAALAACAAYLLVGHRSVYASQRLGMVKSAGLATELDRPIGTVTRRQITVRPGSVADRVLKAGGRRIRPFHKTR